MTQQVCDKCGQKIFQASDKPYAVPDDIMDIVGKLIATNKLQAHESKFISELPTKQALSEKQWKWFCALHKSHLGNWPKKSDKVSASPTVVDKSDSDVPF